MKTKLVPFVKSDFDKGKYIKLVIGSGEQVTNFTYQGLGLNPYLGYVTMLGFWLTWDNNGLTGFRCSRKDGSANPKYTLYGLIAVPDIHIKIK